MEVSILVMSFILSRISEKREKVNFRFLASQHDNLEVKRTALVFLMNF
jgi:hypothetical protein